MKRTAPTCTFSDRIKRSSVRRALLALSCVVAMSGCNRQDTDALSRIGRKMSAQARSGADELSAKLDMPWKGANRDPNLQEKIQQRLRWENTLTDVTFEVQVKDKEVELKGTVKNALQRQRAIELAETVAGVEKVNDGIHVEER